MFRDEENKKPFLVWGSKNIYYAEGNEYGLRFETKSVLLYPRYDKYDYNLVEMGAPPIKLSDGNYLVLYNSASDFPVK